MTRPDLDALSALADAATEGPWTGTTGDSIGGGSIYDRDVMIANVQWDNDRVDPRIRRTRTVEEADANAAFIAASRTAVPDLIAYARELEARIARARAIWDSTDKRVKTTDASGGRFDGLPSKIPLAEAADRMHAALTEGLDHE